MMITLVEVSINDDNNWFLINEYLSAMHSN
jgi:hypothetical protein